MWVQLDILTGLDFGLPLGNLLGEGIKDLCCTLPTNGIKADDCGFWAGGHCGVATWAYKDDIGLEGYLN